MKLISILILVTQLIFIIPKTSAQFRYQLCGDPYSTPSSYQTNLNTTLNSMSSDTRINYGYYNFTTGKNPNKIEATVLCRSDISINDCRSCVHYSVTTLPVACNNTKQAFAFTDNCVTYYTDSKAFHVLTDEPNFALRFDGNTTTVPKLKFNSSLTTLMSSLKHKASLGNSEIKFATGKIDLTHNQPLYGLVQCSPDLSKDDCVDCVEYLISSVFYKYFIIAKPLFIAKGGRVVSPSCNVRYELYPFFKNVTYNAQPPAANRNTTSAQGKTTSILLLLTSFCLFIVDD